MKEYLKMADVFKGGVSVRIKAPRLIECEGVLAANCLCEQSAEYAAHAINSHDELVENMQHYKQETEQWEARATKEASMVQEFDLEIERLRKSLKWAIGNLPFEHPFEWSDEDSHDAHKEAIIASGGTYED